MKTAIVHGNRTDTVIGFPRNARMVDLGNGYFQPAPGTSYWSQPVGTNTYSTNSGPEQGSYPVGPNQSFNNAPYVNPRTVGYPSPTGAGTNSGGGGVSSAPGPGENGYQNPNTIPGTQEYYANQVRSDINSGYDSYFSSLDDILNNGLPQQQAAQNNIAQSQFDQGVSQLDTQRTLGLQDLQTQHNKADTQQNKTLLDISNNIRNLFQSGNVYLGAKGAADSSASNQYSYALTKMGSQQRGDVTSQYASIHADINGRESRLNEIYNGQLKDLSFQKDQQMQSVAQWYADAQNQLKQAKAQGQLAKGQDLASLSKNILDVALQQLQNVQTESANRRASLETWAMNHSNDINSLKSNLASVSNYQAPNVTAQPILGGVNTGGNAAAPNLFGFGNGSDQRTNMFGQPY